VTVSRIVARERLDRGPLVGLGAEWEDLRRTSSTTSPFMSWPWVGAWLETIGSDADLEVHVARDPDSGRLVGIAPFYVATTRRAGLAVRELRMLGSGAAAPDHLDMLIAPGAGLDVATDLWEAVGRNRRWDLLNLDGIVADSHLASVATRRTGDVAQRLTAPYLPLDGGWDIVASRFSGRLRNNLRRYGRKLDRDADVAERMVVEAADLDDTFDQLVRLHQAVRTDKGDPGVFADPDTKRFLRRASHRLLDAGRLRLWRLDADGDPIAIILCARGGDSVAFYTTGYDAAWSKYGPGRRIMARAIRGAIDEGAAEFDFLRGDEPYKREWGTEARALAVVRRPTSLKGRALWAAKSVVDFTRRRRRRGD